MLPREPQRGQTQRGNPGVSFHTYRAVLMPFPLPSILIPAIPSDAAYQLALLICHDRPTGDPSHSIRRRLSSHSAGIPLLQQFDVPPCSADTEGIHMQDAYFLIISGLQ